MKIALFACLRLSSNIISILHLRLATVYQSEKRFVVITNYVLRVMEAPMQLSQPFLCDPALLWSSLGDSNKCNCYRLKQAVALAIGLSPRLDESYYAYQKLGVCACRWLALGLCHLG